MTKLLPNPWLILIALGVLAASNGFTWWKTSSHAESQCVARVRLANATLQAAQDRLAQKISSENFRAAMARSHAARQSDSAYGQLLALIGETSVRACSMPQSWWNKLHEIR